jgi:U32 family peptidase
MDLRRKPEVMSPAGYWPQLHAAIEAGADAIYFGLTQFTARAKVGFTAEELRKVFQTLHRRGVRGFVTFNTLVFEDELPAAVEAISEIAKSGADAIIVQDVGVLKLVRKIAPDLEIHASTQMSVTDIEGTRLALELGAQRVTLARELSLTEIRAIREATLADLEVFVHGALCVAYSGQCFSSEAWGGRSANRGQCAQACRLPYEMLVDGELVDLADKRYLLSPGDLYALKQVPELVAIGVGALKIEGRYKDAEYVAATTAAYRKAVDEAWLNRPLSITPAEEVRLEQVYSRGLAPHFMSGTNHQTVVDGRAPRHRGVLMGRVTSVEENAVWIKPSEKQSVSPLKLGDGLVFDASDWRDPAEREEGGRLYHFAEKNGRFRLEFGNRAVNFSRVRVGDWLWRSDDPTIEKDLRQFTAANTPVYRQALSVEAIARTGQPLHSTWKVGQHQVQVSSPTALSAATKHALDQSALRQQWERLGNSPYRLESLHLETDAQSFASSSLLNEMRRQAVELLQEHQGVRSVITVAEPQQVLAEYSVAAAKPKRTSPPELHLLVRTPQQLNAILDNRLLRKPASITLDYLDLLGLKPSVERVKQSGIAIRVASPRIIKPGEERITDFLIRLGCDLLVRSVGLLHYLRERTKVNLIGDFSFNSANSIAAQSYFDLGVDRLTPTHDLNAQQIAALAAATDAARWEVIAYQHLPVFHMEHCVFCRFLSTGTTFKDCGRPCESHQLQLQDPQMRRHPVFADIGCRNTVFGAEAQEASSHLSGWLSAGIHQFRLEFAHESADEVIDITNLFDRALRGELSFVALKEQLRKAAPQGTTQGSLFVPLSSLTG